MNHKSKCILSFSCISGLVKMCQVFGKLLQNVLIDRLCMPSSGFETEIWLYLLTFVLTTIVIHKLSYESNTGVAWHHHSEFWLLRGTWRGWLVMERVLVVHVPLQFLGYPLSCIMKHSPILPRRISKRCLCIIYESFLPCLASNLPCDIDIHGILLECNIWMF